ncbi:FecR domain-containing protein [Cupriavidus agavae]|uniref:FecR family protein n=1 Tax=Cupriavidus agavae TaxID=1001822 RepID=A0A4V2FH69_9BURK|nr:FecR domain-containing protein [Cupriavidus agavae]RZT39239.1 FecR family protein [Cupriavidus agavae]
MPTSSWYRATTEAATIPPNVAERALEWLVELQDTGASPQVTEAWQRWRTEHPDHERAWQRIESVRGRLQPLASPVAADIARTALASVPAAPPRPPRRQVLKALVTFGFAAGLTMAAREYSPWRQWTADHRTAVGERRTVMLSDGTELLLNTDSAVNIAFDGAERRVRLLAGEILVTTAKDPQAAARPFLVETAQGTARALGTRYSVREGDSATEVCVFAGAVEVRPRDGTGNTLVLPAGACTRYNRLAIEPPVPAESSRVAWAEGFIVARSMRLDDFLAELRRYSPAALSCEPSIAGLRVSGSFPLDDPGKVLETLATTLFLQKETVTRLWGQDQIRLLPGRRS